MFKKMILATAVVGAISISAFAASGNGMGSGCEMEKGMKDKSTKHKGCEQIDNGCFGGGATSLATIKLSAEQKSKIESLKEEFRVEMAKLRIQEKPMMKDPFVVTGGFNKETFKKEMGDKMQKHLDLKAEHLSKVWGVLTPEQQKSITALAK